MSNNPDFAKLTPNELTDFLRGELDGGADNVDYLLSWVYAVACMRDDARREVDSLRAKLDKVRNASRWEPNHCLSGDYVSWSDIAAIIGEDEKG